MYTSIDSSTLQSMLARESPPLLVDVRTPEEFARGRLANAINIPLNELAGRLQEIPPDVDTVVYCLSGGRSAGACGFLSSRDYRQLFNLAGGLADWSRSGKPIVG